MLQNACKTLGFKKNMVYKIPPGGEVNHNQPVAYYPHFANEGLRSYNGWTLYNIDAHILKEQSFLLDR